MGDRPFGHCRTISVMAALRRTRESTPKENRLEQERLHAEIKRLKAALAHSELKGRAYEIMLEIGREQYGIDLEKKPGAKQSKDSKKNNRK